MCPDIVCCSLCGEFRAPCCGIATELDVTGEVVRVIEWEEVLCTICCPRAEQHAAGMH